MRMFSFGHNWQKYSNTVLNSDKMLAAKESVAELLGVSSLKGKSFLDVGCGSGIFSISAIQLGASRVVGIDIDPIAIRVSRENTKKFLPGTNAITFVESSILDDAMKSQLGLFDIVYAWGSLHHTGRMYDAIATTGQFVKPGGIYILSIYNKHFTSPLWRVTKRLYNISPRLIKLCMEYLFAALAAVVKYVTTRQNPFRKERGMDFFCDVVDWLGGLPYEYASPDEVIAFLKQKGFKLEKMIPAKGWTGCNEFVFARGY